MITWPYPQFIAHRGAGQSAPENTLSAFKLGYAHGFRMFECDVTLSKDTIAFLHHDDMLNRTTNATGYVQDYLWKDLSCLDAGLWYSTAYANERLPTLTHIAEFIHSKQAMLNIEIKPSLNREAETGTIVANLVAKLWDIQTSNSNYPLPLLSSFSQTALIAAYTAQPKLPFALLVNNIPDDWQIVLKRLNCIALACEVSNLTQVNVNSIKNAGYYMLAYTCNNLNQAKQCLTWGVNSIITDRLDYLNLFV